jgi:hypothetical protein
VKRDFHEKDHRDHTPRKDRGFVERQKKSKKNQMKNDLKNIVDNMNSANYNDYDLDDYEDDNWKD